jgi:hypothetical protein
MVLPRNIVAKHLMTLCTQAGFPALALLSLCHHGSGTALEFHKITLKGMLAI